MNTITDTSTECLGCPGNDLVQHDSQCLQTWKNPAWINRESYYSWRADRWAWRVIPAVRLARAKAKVTEATGGSMSLRDISKAQAIEDAKWDRAMQNWTDDEVEGLLGR